MSALSQHICTCTFCYHRHISHTAVVSVVQIIISDVIGEDNSNEADDVNGDVIEDETDDDNFDDDDMEIQNDSLGEGDSKKLEEGKTKRRRKRKEKAPQPVTDVLITSRNDVTDDVSLAC